MAQPEVSCCQLEHGEEVCGVIFVAGGDTPEVPEKRSMRLRARSGTGLKQGFRRR